MEYKLVKNAAMKRILFMLFAVIMSTAVCHAAMSNSKVRKETRFLTDKMAYELNLNTAQYNDVYPQIRNRPHKMTQRSKR